MSNILLILLCVCSLVNLICAHLEFKTNPLFDSKLFKEDVKRSLSNCQNTRQARSVQEYGISRRQELFYSFREQRQAPPSPTAWTNILLSTNHQSNQTGLTSSSNPFASTSTCVLNPEGEVGPYWVKGELIRSDIRETQPGIDLYLDIQVIDAKTCQPVPNLYLDIWHCNATGVYSGVNGLSFLPNGDPNDTSIINATFHRGLQPTNNYGYATFATKFPGHYDPRSTHIHVISHLNGQVLPNGTYCSGTVPHIGQLFFDQSLIDTIEALSPYNTNKQVKTPNSQDFVLVGEEDVTIGSDPFANYVMLGNDLSSGILAWITLVVDTEADRTSNASFGTFWSANGGIVQPNAGALVF